MLLALRPWILPGSASGLAERPAPDWQRPARLAADTARALAGALAPRSALVPPGTHLELPARDRARLDTRAALDGPL